MMRFEETAYYRAALVGLQGDLPGVDWRTHEVLWHEQRGDHAVVLASTDSYSSRFEYVYLLLTRLDDAWFPAQQASDSRWIGYDECASTGVFMDISHTSSPTAQRVRVKYGTTQRDVEVRDGHVCLVLWDVDAAEKDPSVEFLEVEIGGKRSPCIVGSLPMTAQQFGEAHLRDDDWGWFEVREAKTTEDRLRLVMAVVEQAELPKDERVLGELGAGPLEDMMSDWLLDQLEMRVPFDAKLRLVLSQIRMEFEPDHLQQRLGLLVRTSPG